jgi:hypothetical protein
MANKVEGTLLPFLSTSIFRIYPDDFNARVRSTLVFATYRWATIQGMHFLLGWREKYRESRRRSFNSDYKLRLYKKVYQSATVDGPAEFLGSHNFSYTPMAAESDQIRLIALLPGEERDHICINLIEHCMQVSGQDYEALSYAWDRSVLHAIECNGQVFHVQESAWLALQALRYPTRQRLLWVDAICINQSDVCERNNQVSKMRKIYEFAKNVVVWLGPAFKESNDAFKLLRILSAIPEHNSHKVFPSEPGEGLAGCGLPHASDKAWAALDVLFWNNWFTRTWIIQEIAVCQRAVLRCGSDECDFEALETASQRILSLSLDAITAVDPKRAARLTTFRNHHRKSRPDAVLSLPEVISLGRESYATDPRDKIIALLGLAEELTEMGIRPDYSKTPRETFIRAVIQIIIGTQSLDVLSTIHDHRSESIPNLPSWVPDFGVRVLPTPFCLLPPFNKWAASLDTKVKVTDDLNIILKKEKIQLRGFLIDHIKHVSDAFLQNTPIAGGDLGGFKRSAQTKYLKELLHEVGASMARSRWRQWRYMAYRLKSYPTGEAIQDVFMNTITAGANLGSGEQAKESYKLCCRFMDKFATAQSSEPVKGEKYKLTADELSQATDFLRLYHRASVGRAFFTTSKGYMGIGNKDARYRNMVVLLEGGRTPYLVRQRIDGTFEFMGECYIRGMMDGELMGSFGGRKETKVFSLR